MDIGEIFRAGEAGHDLITPTASLRFKGDVLEQLCTVQHIVNGAVPGIPRQVWMPVERTPE